MTATTDRSVVHASFTAERTYAAAPARVFRAWSDLDAKRRWFGDPTDTSATHTLDFRVGGEEHHRGNAPGGGPYFRYDAVYADIVDDQRIVLTYDMHMNDDRISVSLVTVELTPDGDGTRLVYTEHGAYLDGLDQPQYREHGTNELLDALGRSLT